MLASNVLTEAKYQLYELRKDRGYTLEPVSIRSSPTRDNLFVAAAKTFDANIDNFVSTIGDQEGQDNRFVFF